MTNAIGVEDDPGMIDLLTFLDAARRPRHELLDDALGTLMRLRREKQITSEEFAVMIGALVAANVSGEIAATVTRSLSGQHNWLTHSRRPLGAGFSVLRHSQSLPLDKE